MYVTLFLHEIIPPYSEISRNFLLLETSLPFLPPREKEKLAIMNRKLKIKILKEKTSTLRYPSRRKETNVSIEMFFLEWYLEIIILQLMLN